MKKLNFMQYNEEAEMPNGDYWKFLEVTGDILLNDNLYLYNINEVINKIANEELKLKMKKKIISLIMENTISFYDINYKLDIFNCDEIKLLLQHEFDTNIIKYVSNEEKVLYYSANIKSYISLLKRTNDSEWEYFIITNILNIVKDYDDKNIILMIIESNNQNKKLYDMLIHEYYSYLPEPYKNFLKMKEDPEYVYKKSLKFLNEDIDIGIDPRISIAPEIEANNDYNIEIELIEQKGFEDYVVSRDATVYNGNEVSPRHPFHNTSEDISKFCALCETMQELGYYYSEESENAAGQINLGLDYLDTKEAILNFYEIYGNCEELLYYISSEEGQLFRQDVYANSRIKAISEIIGVRILDEELTRKDIIKLFNFCQYGDNEGAIKGLEYKGNSVCLRGNNDKNHRLEFRIPNGGCNYRTWIDNIRLYGKMMEVSKKLADMMKKDSISAEEERLLRIKIDLQDNNLSFRKKLVMLMNLLFDDDNIKQIYYNRYKGTIKKIKETNSRKYVDNYSRYEPSFDEVEFVSQYHSMLNPDYDGSGLVVTYDPETDIITSNQKNR